MRTEGDYYYHINYKHNKIDYLLILRRWLLQQKDNLFQKLVVN